MEADIVKEYLPLLTHRHDRKNVLLEVGCGLSTIPMLEHCDCHSSKLYGIDTDKTVIALLETAYPGADSEFINKKSEVGIPYVLDKESSSDVWGGRKVNIDFAFFDGAPCAYSTMRDFLAIEPFMEPGSIYVMDNARLPEKEDVIPELVGAGCRKGKVVVPYLLSSPWWEVFAHPHSAGGMIAAIKRDKPVQADTAYSSARAAVPRVRQVTKAVEAITAQREKE